MVPKQTLERIDLAARPLIVQPQENDAPVGEPVAIDLLTKVLMLRDQNPVLVKRFLEDEIIFHPAGLSIH
jgi:hypothetical protein